MKPSQAEFLLRLAENNDARGDEVDAEINRLGREHAHALLEELELLNKAMELNRQGRDRFAHFMPRQAQQQFGQTAIGRTLADQRAALIQGGKDETAQKEQRPASGQRP
jgi:hypothetical protein